MAELMYGLSRCQKCGKIRRSDDMVMAQLCVYHCEDCDKPQEVTCRKCNRDILPDELHNNRFCTECARTNCQNGARRDNPCMNDTEPGQEYCQECRDERGSELLECHFCGKPTRRKNCTYDHHDMSMSCPACWCQHCLDMIPDMA